VGVAPQYASVLGKNANCQTLVSLTLSSGEVPVPVALRLFLPESWTSDPARLAKAGVPENRCEPRTKPEIALAEIDQLVAAGMRFSVVLADAGYGISAPFRHGLSARALLWAVGIPRIQKVFAADVGMVPPPPARRRSMQPLVPAEEATSAEAMLADEPWETISWRQGRKGALRASFVAKRVRIADGRAVRLHGRNNQHMPGEEAWLVGEHRSSGERKYYLSNLPAEADLKTLASAIKARWSCEQAHQQMKEELGLDHFEGRSWRGLHRHALMTMMAMAFLQHRRLAEAERGKKNRRPATQPQPAGRAPRHPDRSGGHAFAPTTQMPALPAMDQTAQAA
jgi:SRSO17 transposase